MNIEDIERHLDKDDEDFHSYIDHLYFGWDKGDCSKLSLLKILLIQEILKERQERNNKQRWYFGEYELALETLIDLNIDGKYTKEPYKNYEGYELI